MANDIIITPVSASIQFSGSANASIKLTVDASGSLSITGNSGSLFSITDNLSGSLMSVNTIAGLPILEVFSDNRVNIGKYASEAIKIQSGGSDVALGSGSVMFVTSSGRVGIGTTSPSTILDVNKASGDSILTLNNTGNGNTSGINFNRERLTGGTGFNAASIFVDSDTSSDNALLYIQAQSTSAGAGVTSSLSANNGVRLLLRGGTGIFSIENGASETFRIGNNGNVGIGTTNPVNKLDVVGNISCSAITASLFFGTASVANALNTSNSYKITNLTASNISASGNISSSAIWTANASIYNPNSTAATLEVAGPANSSGSFSVLASSGDNTASVFTVYGDNSPRTPRFNINRLGNVGIGTTVPGVKLDVFGTMRILTNGVPASGSGMEFSYVGGGSPYGTIYSYNRDGSAYIDTILGAGGNQLFLKASGNVGIGTTSPNTLLNVGSGTPSTAANGLQFGSDTSANLYRISTGVIKTDGGLTAAGNITIAKNGAYLYLNGTNGDAEILWQANSVNKWAVGMNVGDATQNFNIYNYTTATTNLTILSASGNVGIGTANPTNKLNVVGNISCSAITASLFFGTSSWATNATTAQTASSLTIANNYQVTSLSINTSSVLLPLTIHGTSYSASASGTAANSIVRISAAGTNAILDMGVNADASPGFAWLQPRSKIDYSVLSNLSLNPVGGNVGIGTINPTARLQLGTLAAVSTATPEAISLGGTYSSAAGSNPKLRVWTDGTYSMGLGASADQLDYILGRSNYSHVFYADGSQLMVIKGTGNVGIGTTNPSYKLQVVGSFSATTKSFDIEHPTKLGKRLVYGSLESPYHGVRLTGKGKLIKGKGVIQLPDYINSLVDFDNANVQITNIKHNKAIYVDNIDEKNNIINVVAKIPKTQLNKDLEFYWTFTAVRKDVPNLQVEL